MARRKQKFTFIHLLAMAALMIWLPALIGHLAGISDEDLPPRPPADFEPAAPIDVKPVTHTQPQDTFPSDVPQIRQAPAELVLTETLISATGKTAVINDLAYQEGQLLNQTGYPLRIRSILAGRVILEGDGGLYELRRHSLFE